MVPHDAAHFATGETARLPKDEINYVSSCQIELGELLPRIIQKCSGSAAFRPSNSWITSSGYAEPFILRWHLRGPAQA